MNEWHFGNWFGLWGCSLERKVYGINAGKLFLFMRFYDTAISGESLPQKYKDLLFNDEYLG